MSGPMPPYNQSPYSRPLYGQAQYGPPPNTNRRRGPFGAIAGWWQRGFWGKIGVLSLVPILACCSCLGVAIVVSQTPAGKQLVAQYNATETAYAGALSGASATATSTPLPGQGDHMSLGADFVQVGTGFEIVHPQGSFHAADPFAYVVHLGKPFGTTQVEIVLVQVHAGGTETVFASNSIAVSNPKFTQFAAKETRTDNFMGSGDTGTYRLEITNGTTILASASFIYLG